MKVGSRDLTNEEKEYLYHDRESWAQQDDIWRYQRDDLLRTVYTSVTSVPSLRYTNNDQCMLA